MGDMPEWLKTHFLLDDAPKSYADFKARYAVKDGSQPQRYGGRMKDLIQQMANHRIKVEKEKPKVHVFHMGDTEYDPGTGGIIKSEPACRMCGTTAPGACLGPGCARVGVHRQ